MDEGYNHCRSTSSHIEWNELIYSKLDILHTLARQYDHTREIFLLFQFLYQVMLVRECNYESAPEDDIQEFIDFVKESDHTVFDFFDNKVITVYDYDGSPVDFTHLCVMIYNIITESGKLSGSQFVEHTYVRNLACCTRDLHKLVVDAYLLTNASNDYTYFYNSLYSIIGNERYSMGMKKLLADIDAYNFVDNLVSPYGQPYLFGSACRCYYNNLDNGGKSESCLRFSQFIGKDMYEQFADTVRSCARKYWLSSAEVFTRSNGKNDHKESLQLTKNQCDAACNAFVEYIWRKYQKERTE